MIGRAGCFGLALLAMLPVSTAHGQRVASPISRLEWMAGCWRQTSDDGATVVDEQWMAPTAGTMLGMSRTVRHDTLLVEFEQLRILERDGRLVFHAEPSGQSPAVFTEAVRTDTLVRFDNQSHDFPQRVVYQRTQHADSLIARVEGERNGRIRVIAFRYARVACAVGGAER